MADTITHCRREGVFLHDVIIVCKGERGLQGVGVGLGGGGFTRFEWYFWSSTWYKSVALSPPNLSEVLRSCHNKQRLHQAALALGFYLHNLYLQCMQHLSCIHPVYTYFLHLHVPREVSKNVSEEKSVLLFDTTASLRSHPCQWPTHSDVSLATPVILHIVFDFTQSV